MGASSFFAGLLIFLFGFQSTLMFYCQNLPTIKTTHIPKCIEWENKNVPSPNKTNKFKVVLHIYPSKIDSLKK